MGRFLFAAIPLHLVGADDDLALIYSLQFLNGKKTKNYSLQFLYESYRARSCRRPVLLERRARTNYSLQFLTLSSMRTTIIFTAIPRMVRPAKLFTAIPPRAENSIIRCNSSLSVCSGPLFRSAPLLALYSLQFLLMS